MPDNFEPRFGFVNFAETWNGRLAMLGILIGLTTELLTGQGVLVQFDNRKVDGYIIDISKSTTFTSKINPIISLNTNSVKISNEFVYKKNQSKNK